MTRMTKADEMMMTDPADGARMLLASAPAVGWTSHLPWRRSRAGSSSLNAAARSRADVLATCELAWAHLKLVWKDRPDPFVITSIRPHALQARIAHALALAAAGSADPLTRVLLIDADLQAAPLRTLTGARLGDPGLSEALRSDLTIAQTARDVSPRLTVMPAGADVASSTDALSSGRIKSLLAEAQEKFTYVVIAAPPMSARPDAAILAAAAGNLLLCVGDVDAVEAAATKAAIAACGTNLRGLIYLDPSAAKLRT